MKPATQTFGVSGIEALPVTAFALPDIDQARAESLRSVLESLQRRLFTLKDSSAEEETVRVLAYDIATLAAELKGVEEGRL